jgi:hypothetical protein
MLEGLGGGAVRYETALILGAQAAQHTGSTFLQAAICTALRVDTLK